MATLKCKMCGGDLNVKEGLSVIECEYCGTSQTVTTNQDENLQGLYNRANLLRMKSEFDKAEAIYEKILQVQETEAEAHWGIVLCQYGIEYVEDPKTFKRVPTCHRTSYEAVVVNEEYKLAVAYADAIQKNIYEQEAKTIDEIQKGILALSQNEEPYDVFICYKETDANGKRTVDSVIANDIYYQLTQEGFKVFYAAITLEEKLGSEYEPSIFAALNSAKVMLAVGTKEEHFNAVWVKNEWSRYLKLMKKDRSKMLIPCYRDMDAYELPEEFSHLQAQDMSKIGFINDLVRGIKKILVKETATVEMNQIVSANPVVNHNALLERGFIALEDKEWDKAKEYFDGALNQDAKLGAAYWGIHLAEAKCQNSQSYAEKRLALYGTEKNVVYTACEEATEKVLEVAKQYAVKEFLSEDDIICSFKYDLKFESDVEKREHEYQLECHYLDNQASIKRALQFADEKTKQEVTNIIAQIKDELRSRAEHSRATYDKTMVDMQNAYQLFLNNTIKSVKMKSLEAQEKLTNRNKRIYEESAEAMKTATTKLEWEKLVGNFMRIKGYKDADVLAEVCHERLKVVLEENKQKDETYHQALEKMKQVNIENPYDILPLEEAIQIFESLSGWQKADEYVLQCKKEIENRKKEKIKFQKNEKKRNIQMCVFIGGIIALVVAAVLLNQFLFTPNKYKSAKAFLEEEKYEEAIEKFAELEDYKDSKEQLIETKYLYIQKNLDYQNETIYEYLCELKDNSYKDCEEIYNDLYKWNVKSIVNLSEDDKETDVQEVDRMDDVYFHLFMTGGYPGEQKPMSLTVSTNKGVLDTIEGEQTDGQPGCIAVRNIEYGTTWIKFTVEGEGIYLEKIVNVK